MRRILPWILVFLLFASQVLANTVVPIQENEPAPFTGLLVPECQFAKLLEAQLAAEDFKGKLEVQKNLTADLELIYAKRLEVAMSPKWYESPLFNRWLGFGIGVVVTGFAIWGGSELSKKMR